MHLRVSVPSARLSPLVLRCSGALSGCGVSKAHKEFQVQQDQWEYLELLARLDLQVQRQVSHKLCLLPRISGKL